MAEISYILIEDDDSDVDGTGDKHAVDKNSGDGDVVVTVGSTSLRCDNSDVYIPDLNLTPSEFETSTVLDYAIHSSSRSGDVSNPNSSVTCVGLFDRSNLGSCAMDLVPGRVEESSSDPNLNLNLGPIGKNEMNGGLGFPMCFHHVNENYEGFLEPSGGFGSVYEFGESVELREQIFYMDGVPVVDFESKSDDNRVLCLDSFEFEDARDLNNNQVGRDVDGNVNVNVDVRALQGEEVIQVDVNNMEANTIYQYVEGDDEDDEEEYEYVGPASKAVIENLDLVLLTKEDVENNNSFCAICKEDMNAGDMAKQLPCFHRYHGDCIVPWLGMRNTCPICRFELPTDDPEYEHRRNLRAGRSQQVTDQPH